MSPLAPTSKTESPKFISRRGLATRWEVSAMSIRRMQREGRLKAYYLGRDARYALTDVEQIEQKALVAA
jgi:hypothetical protein